MTEDQFWQMLETSQQQSHDCESQAKVLQALLFECSAQEIIDFDRIFRDKLIEAYRWDLWGIACLIQGSCSKRGFQNFCAWFIGQGRDTYQQILDDPQNILTLVEEDEELLGCDALVHASHYAYDDVVGEDMPDEKRPYPDTLMGDRIEGDELAARFPKVAEVFVK